MAAAPWACHNHCKILACNNGCSLEYKTIGMLKLEFQQLLLAIFHGFEASAISALVAVSSHPRSHFSDKKHLWDCTTSQMPDINQYKSNPTEMAIFLIQTMPEMHLAGQFLQELPWSRVGGRRERAEPSQLTFPPHQFLQRCLSLFKPNFLSAQVK